MIKNADRLLQRFWKSKDGNFAILSAVALSTILFAVAVAVDSSRLVQASSRLKDLTDSAALAATVGQNKTIDERRAAFETAMESGLAISPELLGYTYNLTYKTDGNVAVLKATSNSEASLFFPATRGNGKFVNAASEVTVGREHIEVALVLDISSSMNGPRIKELQASATNFVQTLMNNNGINGRIAISIVPFGGTVKLPNDLSYMLNPPPTNLHWVGGQWNGCLQTPPSEFQNGITPQHRLDYVPDFFAFGLQNNWCPGPGNEMVPLSRSQNVLLDKISNLTLSDGTGLDIGVAWGLATLDRRWRGHQQFTAAGAPRNFNSRTKKIMVVMTDGKITFQLFPNSSELAGPLPFQASNQLTVTQEEAETGFQDICDLTRSKDIEVFTIGFELDASKVDSLAYCGTTPDHNFEADLGELSTAFSNIAASISGLRLSQ